jgi:hypothetical protein
VAKYAFNAHILKSFAMVGRMCSLRHLMAVCGSQCQGRAVAAVVAAVLLIRECFERTCGVSGGWMCG